MARILGLRLVLASDSDANPLAVLRDGIPTMVKLQVMEDDAPGLWQDLEVTFDEDAVE